MDRTERPKRPALLYFDWWGQQQNCNWNPYNKSVNGLLWAYGNLLRYLNPKSIDVDLARLYFLANGGSEHNQDPDDEFDWNPYKKIYANDIRGIKRWLYTAIHTTVQNFKLMFDPNRTGYVGKDGTQTAYDMEMNSWTESNYVGPVGCENRYLDLGYTSDLSPDTSRQLFELVSDIEHGKIDMCDDVQVKHLKFRLESIKVGMMQDHSRFEMNYLDEAYGAGNSVPRPPSNEKQLVTTFSVPLYSLLPCNPDIKSDDQEEWGHFMHKTYCQCRLPVYGLIFEILSGLRDVCVEGSLRDFTGARMYQLAQGWEDINHEDKVEHRAEEETGYRWIHHLPSYRPEFIITLHDFQRFDYWRKRNLAVNEFDPGYLFLLEAIHAYHPNFSVSQKEFVANTDEG